MEDTDEALIDASPFQNASKFEEAKEDTPKLADQVEGAYTS